MSGYHLNLVRADNSEASLHLEEIVELLGKIDSDVAIKKHGHGIKEFILPNLTIGQLYFSNGNLWSIYTSDEQAIGLFNLATKLGLIVQGEEQETYYIDKKTGKLVDVAAKKVPQSKVSIIKKFIIDRLWGTVFIWGFFLPLILIFVKLGWLN